MLNNSLYLKTHPWQTKMPKEDLFRLVDGGNWIQVRKATEKHGRNMAKKAKHARPDDDVPRN